MHDLNAYSALTYTYTVFIFCAHTHVGLNMSSAVMDIHQLMNVVPLIQEKWSDIGTRLKFPPGELNKFWKTADEHQIPPESRNTFCCIQMLKQWFQANDKPFVSVLIKAIDVPYIGLNNKISSIKTALTTESFAPSIITEGTNLPEKLEQQYIDMKAKFCLELIESECKISDILVYLRLCNVKSELFTEISYDYPSLIKLLEKHDLLSKADLSWLKYIATSSGCTKAAQILENYEKLLFADKIIWSNKHSKGTYLVGKISRSSEFVTIKDISNAKSVVSKVVNLQETDSKLDSSEIGSVIFYWRVIKDVTVHVPEFVDPLIAKECEDACLTHIGIVKDGKTDLEHVDNLIGTYVCMLLLYSYLCYVDR